jgi:phage recombination protein Bet
MSDNAITVTQAQETAGQLARRMFFANIPNDVVNAALLVCQRYNLDPLLKHIALIYNKKNGQYTIYITRDGLVHNAHQSGQLDGMHVTFGKSDDGVWAECTVYRKDMKHPFVYRVYASEYQASGYAWKTHPRAMLTKAAEVFSLRRAFNVSLPVREEMDAVIERDGLEEVPLQPREDAEEIIEGEILEDPAPTPPPNGAKAGMTAEEAAKVAAWWRGLKPNGLHDTAALALLGVSGLGECQGDAGSVIGTLNERLRKLEDEGGNNRFQVVGALNILSNEGKLQPGNVLAAYMQREADKALEEEAEVLGGEVQQELIEADGPPAKTQYSEGG